MVVTPAPFPSFGTPRTHHRPDSGSSSSKIEARKEEGARHLIRRHRGFQPPVVIHCSSSSPASSSTALQPPTSGRRGLFFSSLRSTPGRLRLRLSFPGDSSPKHTPIRYIAIDVRNLRIAEARKVPEPSDLDASTFVTPSSSTRSSLWLSITDERIQSVDPAGIEQEDPATLWIEPLPLCIRSSSSPANEQPSKQLKPPGASHFVEI